MSEAVSKKTVPHLPGVIDSHAHLTMAPLSGDVEGVLERARAVGVSQVLTIGTTRAESEAALALARAHDGVFATVGVHPHDAVEHSEVDLEELRDLAADPCCVTVGEIGLDYHYDHSPRDVQRYWFRRQMELGREFSLPVVIHTREAEADTEAILREFPDVTGVLHCYSSGIELARAGLELGYYLSFSGIVTFKNAEQVREVARMAPLERILVETDSPYLAPVPLRGKTNEPAYVTFVARCMAEIKGISEAEMVTITADNTRRLFGLTPG